VSQRTSPSRRATRPESGGIAAARKAQSTLQLSPDRDPGAPNGEPKQSDHMDLHGLAERDLIRNLPAALLAKAPRIDAPSPTARSALGYMHVNCGHCHNDNGPLADVELVLQQKAADATSAGKVLSSIVGRAADTRAFGLTTRVVPGRCVRRQVGGSPDLLTGAGRLAPFHVSADDRVNCPEWFIGPFRGLVETGDHADPAHPIDVRVHRLHPAAVDFARQLEVQMGDQTG